MRIPLVDLERAVAEQASLRGRFVDNVYQCGPRTFLLRLRPGKVALVVDLAPDAARVLVTDRPPEVPERPPALGAILRRALRGARFLGSSLPARDRVVALDFGTADGPRRMVVEAFSRHGNLFLLDAQGRVERLLDGGAARHRGNAVGEPYRLPPAPTIPEEPSLLAEPLPQGPFAANLALDRRAREELAGRAEQQDSAASARSVERLRRARRAVERDLERLEDPARLREQGELLLCHFAQLRTGMRSFRGVALDPKLSPPENVERLFERARKAARARPLLEERRSSLDRLLARAEAGEELPARELSARRKEQDARRRPYRTFRSLDGHRILVGKGGRDNDETTLRVAGPHDLFLHVRGVPGAHVIVPLGRDQPVPEQALLDAAHLALHYSKRRDSAAAEISYTRRKHVSKPRGAKPGLVSVRQERVLRLRREPERLARLLMTAGEEE